MIDPVALVVLQSDSVVTTPDGAAEAGQVAAHEFDRADARTLHVRTDDGNVYISRPDIDHIIDLRTDEYRPRQLKFFFD